MINAKIYNNIAQSLVKHLNDFKEANSIDAQYFNFDAHAQESELPPGLHIGPAGVGISIEEEGISVTFGYGVLIDEDPNLFRITDLVSQLAGWCWPGTKIPIYDAETTEVVSWMKVVPTMQVTPVSKMEIRSAQFITGQALVELSAGASAQ